MAAPAPDAPAVRFGLFYEHQLPRPWSETAEAQLLADSLAQVELADSLGYDFLWAVEHHFLEEYSHSSAPEVFLAAASQRTRRIRLGHGVVQLPPAVNHPARVAERIATLDLISGGRVEFGTGEASSAAELGAFGVRRSTKREQWSDAIDAITRMFVETPFAGWQSPWLRMPVRNVVPKPAQKPHPPLWVACSRRETIELAARSGIGALSFSFAEPEDAARWADEYYALLRSAECRPVGFAVNPNIAVVLPMMCHADESTALERGTPGARFFGQALAHYYGGTPHEPGRTDLAARFAAQRERSSDAASGEGAGSGVAAAAPDSAADDPSRPGDVSPLTLRVVEAATGSVRGAIGTPAQLTDLLERYERAGVDQAIFVMQAGATRHEHICESLELFAREVMPAFAERRGAAEAAKAERLAPAIAAALRRRSPPRPAPAGVVVDERAELAASASGVTPPAAPGRGLRKRVRREAGRGAAASVSRLLGRAVGDRDDASLERRFGSARAQRLLLSALLRGVRRERTVGLRADIAFWLTATTVPDRGWSLEVRDGSVSLGDGAAHDPSLTLRLPLATFMRLLAGRAQLGELATNPAVDADGDLTLLQRLGEMLGAPSPY